jgi:hypothetical protein
LFPRILTLFKKMVVEPTALIKGMLHLSYLSLSWIHSIFKRRLMHKYTIAQIMKGSND